MLSKEGGEEEFTSGACPIKLFAIIIHPVKLFYLYTIAIIHPLSIYTSMTHSLLSLKLLALALNSLDTMPDVRLKLFTLLF